MGRNTKQKIVKPRILHRAHVAKDLEKIFSTPLFFVISSMGFGRYCDSSEILLPAPPANKTTFIPTSP